jgi:hypothetical protein
MRPIHKFILHVVHNWKNELNEAYSEGAVKKFIEKFREEADDLNINITDEQLKQYIQRFDVLKNSPKIQEKDLNKYSLSALIKLVTASKGAEAEDEDKTPDVVYQDNGITIWNGSKEGNCIMYGQGEKWCITRGSYGNYRYSSGRGYPTFYLAKNANLSDSDPLSFVAIQVRDNDEDERYVYTNRKNSPHESNEMSFSGLTSEVPWLNDVPNIKNVLKYIPLSNTEKVTQLYKNNSIGIREWMKLPFEAKKQYLVVRKDKSELFEDVTNSEFVSKYLPKYPQIANFIAITPGIISNNLLLANLDKFDNQDKKSIIANLRDKVSTTDLKSDSIPFDAKKLLTYLNKWELSSNERLYVTKDGSTIVRLKLGDTISVGLYQAEDDYPNIKLNQRTSKYLLDYPELDKIPLRNIIKLSDDGVIDKSLIKKVLDNAKADPNSAIAVKDVDGKEIVIDSNSFASYQIDKNGNIVSIPFESEEVQKAFAEEKDNESFQQNAINLVRTAADDRENLPATLDKNAFMSILKAAPYDKRKIQVDGKEYIVLPSIDENEVSIIVKDTNKSTPEAVKIGGTGDNWRRYSSYFTMGEKGWKEYFAYMRNENQIYSEDELLALLRKSYGFSGDSKIGFIKATPPINPTGRYTVAYYAPNNTAYLVNKQNPRESFKVSDRSGKLLKANVSSALSRQLLGGTPDQATPTAPGAQTQPGVRRRGRPAAGAAPAAPAAPAADGGINVTQRMQEAGLETSFLRLPRADYRRLAVTNAASILPSTDRGASRRNNQLGIRGRVTSVLSIGASKIYFIRLSNGTNVASINVQPGNRNYVLFGNEQGNVAIAQNSPTELLQALQNRNLAEMRRYLTQEYLANNPEHLEEVRGLIQHHIAETTNN